MKLDFIYFILNFFVLLLLLRCLCKKVLNHLNLEVAEIQISMLLDETVDFYSHKYNKIQDGANIHIIEIISNYFHYSPSYMEYIQG